MPNHPKTVAIDGFKGLNNVLRPERTPPQYFKEADNVDIDKSGGVQKRKGRTLISAGDFHSLWADTPYCFSVRDGDLVSINKQYQASIIESGLGTNKVDYFRLDDLVYFSSTSMNGVIEDGAYVRSWGLTPPSSPTLIPTNGSLTPGTYQVTLVYRGSDGQESGAQVATKIDLTTTGSGIIVEDIPMSDDPRVTTVLIYMTHDNGEDFYYKGQVANGTDVYGIYDDTGLRIKLDSFNLRPPPRGHIVTEGHGRSWVAEDNILWYSEPYQYELFNYQKNYIPLPERIRAVMMTEGGAWIAADKLYYMKGRNPEDARLEMKEPIKVVEGSDVRIPGAYIFIENTPIGYKWIVHSDKGIYVCFNDGIALNMTSQNYEFPKADYGAACFIQEDGINRYTSLLKRPTPGSENATVGDIVTATIVRNGIALTD